jgi:D-alanyl-D-alanine carboxypeptidase (penicillin-binding protein 5/6)
MTREPKNIVLADLIFIPPSRYLYARIGENTHAVCAGRIQIDHLTVRRRCDVRMMILCFMALLLFPLIGESAPAPVLNHAHSAVLMESATGEVIYDKYGDKRMPPASTTKILTALIAIESGRLAEPVTVSEYAAKTKGSRMRLSAGQVLSLEELVTGLLLRSGNDAAVAIAEHLAGSVEAFAEQMNERAYALGAHDCRFVNPHGLPAPDHYVTAKSLARIARCAMENETFADIVAKRTAEIDWEDTKGTHHQSLRNTNKLLWQYPAADGIKTGTTGEAGACLVASAYKDGHRYIAVLLNDPTRWQDAAALLKWGFDEYVLLTGGQAGDDAGEATLVGGYEPTVRGELGDTLYALVKKETAEAALALTVWDEPIVAPVSRGQKIGTRFYYADGTLISSVDIVASADAPHLALFASCLFLYKDCLKYLSELSLI